MRRMKGYGTTVAVTAGGHAPVTAPPGGPAGVTVRDSDVYVIGPRPSGTLARFGEIWRYRHLLRIFAGLYLRKLYGNTWLGKLWIPLRPLLSVGLQALVFGGLLKARSDGIPYFLFLVTGAGAWQLFGEGWYIGTRSLQIQRRILSRIHVPRLVPVLASMSIGLTWVALYAAMLVAGVLYYWIAEHHLYVHISVRLLEAGAGLVLVAAMAVSLALWTSILGAQARDPRFIVRHILRVWYFATPVIYPLSALPPKLTTLAQLNPLTTPIEMLRQGLFGVGEVHLTGLLITIGMILIVGYGGLRFFARSEARALDYL